MRGMVYLPEHNHFARTLPWKRSTVCSVVGDGTDVGRKIRVIAQLPQRVYSRERLAFVLDDPANLV
jgi:hypothetical protein